MTPERGRTIFALSSGHLPAAIAIVRISGPAADDGLTAICGNLPEPRRASYRALRDPGSGALLDQALVLRFPGPNSATGENLVELHLHGGRAVVAAVLDALACQPDHRPAEPGEFTRRAFENGRIDLAEAEGLSDLLQAETEGQRRAAMFLAGGSLSRQVERWQSQVLRLSARLEALLDFDEDGDVPSELPETWHSELRRMIAEARETISGPTVERLRSGIRVVIAGPPNAGKSSLLNWLAGRRAAITSSIAGTTRDPIEAPTAIGGSPFLLVDTAGLRESEDEVESIGVDLARQNVEAADLILWLGETESCPDRERAIVVRSKLDLRNAPDRTADINVSAETGAGMAELVQMLIERAKASFPREDEFAMNRRHRALLIDCLFGLEEAEQATDPLIASEGLRIARASLDGITGRAGVEEMLDALFGTFCIGK